MNILHIEFPIDMETNVTNKSRCKDIPKYDKIAKYD